MVDGINSGSFINEMMSEYRKDFKDADKDKNSKVSFDEFKNVIKQESPGISSSELKKEFSEFDHNADGQIEQSEFEKVIKAEFTDLLKEFTQSQSQGNSSFEDLFSEIDTNKDQSLSFEEVKKDLNTNEPQVSDKEIAELFKEADTNQDGLVDKSEFAAVIEKEEGADGRTEAVENSSSSSSRKSSAIVHPDDLNRDGKIDLKERQKAKQKAQQNHILTSYNNTTNNLGKSRSNQSLNRLI